MNLNLAVEARLPPPRLTGTLGETVNGSMQRYLPGKFQIREWILSTLAVVLAVMVLYHIFTAEPRAIVGLWEKWQFLGTILFVAVGGRDRAFFTGLYCILVSGTLGCFVGLVAATGMPLQSDSIKILFVMAFMLFLSVIIPVGFACLVTGIVAFLESRFYRYKP